ncbi:hypothetical protein [Parendozoicomonas haliclonae]|uniref:Uncharacterized protein n=1 Tax=Parendozoicomonas haliclonae TaxID=1960125 RepID=A0A1X7AK56_9GAMM|nr:hypothetical protein [Parendozoicomonas haliclonae]SMA47022.1 hypothetical protein EHSB41UT_02283 [Parendozoicomonas haliclonae]
MIITDTTLPQQKVSFRYVNFLACVALAIQLSRIDELTFTGLLLTSLGFTALLILIFYIRSRSQEFPIFEWQGNIIRYGDCRQNNCPQVDLDRVIKVHYNKNILVFEGEYPYMHEIFFSNSQRIFVREIIDQLEKQKPNIQITPLAKNNLGSFIP